MKSPWLIATYCIFYAAVIITVALHRWWQFEYYYFDHGIFDSSLWQVAHGQWPMIDHLRDNGFRNQLGDHFTPTLYLLTPIYWLTSWYGALIIVQNLFVAASAFVIWKLARALKVSSTISFAILLAYTWFLGLQNALIAGFHTELIALFTTAMMLWCLEKKQWGWFWMWFALTLGCKEIFASIGVGVGMSLLLRRQFRLGALVGVVSIAYFFAVTQFVIPAFSGLPYGYHSQQVSLWDMIENLFLPTIKLKTLFTSFASFGFLGVFSLAAAPLLAQDFFVRFVMGTSQTWELGLHYSAMSALFLAYSAVKGAEWLQRYEWYKKWSWIHAGAIVGAVAFFHYTGHGALGVVYNRAYYQQTRGHVFLHDFITQIPADGLVMTQNNLAVQLSHTHQVMLLRDDYENWLPDTIALDIRAGQNPNNFWPENSRDLYDRLLLDPRYELHRVSQEQLYFRKVASESGVVAP